MGPPDSTAVAMAASAAHLLIHAESALDPTRSRSERPLQRLRALAGGLRRRARSPLGVQIDTLCGDSVLVLEDAGATVEVALPAGTYHVTTRLGELRRGYTVTLSQGQCFDLYLRPDAQQR